MPRFLRVLYSRSEPLFELQHTNKDCGVVLNTHREAQICKMASPSNNSLI